MSVRSTASRSAVLLAAALVMSAGRMGGTDVTGELVALRPDGGEEVVLATGVLGPISWPSN